MNNGNKYYNKNQLTKDTLKIIEEVEKLIQQDGFNNVKVSVFFEYVRKVEDRLWNKNNRNYYLHNVPLESISDNAQVIENILVAREPSVEEGLIKKEKINIVINKLKNCTSVQKTRYIKHYYLQMSITEIAREELVSEGAVRQSLKRVDKMLNK